jgi:hypothetical protein
MPVNYMSMQPNYGQQFGNYGAPGNGVQYSGYQPGANGDPLDPQGMAQLIGSINLQPLDQSVQNFADMANRQGPSAWANMANQQQDTLEANSRERGAAENNAQTAQALDNLGSSGGITSGARERAAEGGAKNYMNMSQDAARQGGLNKLQIGVNDQQNKIQEMGQLPGMESAALQPQFQQAGMYQNLYNQQMQDYAAQQQANAIANSGKK